MLPNDNVSTSVGHLDHVLTVYSPMEHATWKPPATRWFPGRVLLRAVDGQDVIKMSDGRRNVVIR